MKFLRKHIVPVCAVFALTAVGCYEAYWLRGMYRSESESVRSIIGSSVTGAEVEEYLDRLKSGAGQDTLLLSVVRPGAEPKIVSMSLDSAAGKVNEVSIYKLDNPRGRGGNGNPGPDMERVQAVLRAYLDSAGLDLDCRLLYEENSRGAVPAAMRGDSTGRFRDGDVILTVPSRIHDGQYRVLCSSLPGYIAARMTGVTAVSAGILLIVALAFFMMERTIRKRRRLEEMRNDFAQNITHELKTPIAVAYAAGDTLLEYGLGDDPVKRKEYLEIIRDQLDRLGGMVEMILSTTMEDRSGLRLDCAVTPVRPLLETAAAQIRMKAGKPCEVKVSVTPENLEAAMDRRLMSSVILTLLDNALKYSGESVSISVEACGDGEKTVISVSDNGIGIALADQKHIFEKFYRVPTGNRHDVKGYGIGLFFAKSIVEKHNGRISVSSRPGKGSSFVIEL